MVGWAAPAHGEVDLFINRGHRSHACHESEELLQVPKVVANWAHSLAMLGVMSLDSPVTVCSGDDLQGFLDFEMREQGVAALTGQPFAAGRFPSFTDGNTLLCAGRRVDQLGAFHT